jgi:5,6-dimethylbenzimidazole synthase
MEELEEFPPQWRRGVYEAIARRRDIRSFHPAPIAPDALARVLNAAHHAGSVGFSQPWNFILVDDAEVRRRIHDHVNAERMRAAEGFDAERREQYLSSKLEGILDAPLNICVTCDRKRLGPAIIGRNTIHETDIYSTYSAVQNLWLAARAEGIGIGWVSILKPEILRQILGIPDNIAVVAYLCAGYPIEFYHRPMLETAGWLPRLPLSSLVFNNRWDQAVSTEMASALDECDGGVSDMARKPVANE